jgi:hypothetical protein
MGDTITAGRDALVAKNRSILTVGGGSNPTARVKDAYASLSPAEKLSVMQTAQSIGGDTNTFVLNLGVGGVVEASLEMATAVLNIIDGVIRRRR